MPARRSRSAAVPADEALRLPRPPGVIRRFWARHPLFADILIAAVCLLLALAPAVTFQEGEAADVPDAVWTWAPLPLVVTAASVLLVWRRRLPTLVFVASFVVAATYLLSPVPIGGPLLFVTSYSLAVYRSSRAVWTGLAIGLGALAALALGLASTGSVPLVVALNAIVGESVMGLIGTLIGVNVGNRKRYVEAIIDRSRQLLIERDQQGELAASAERARIAREMHDIVSHSLTVIVALAEGAAATANRERARGAMDAAADTARGALDEMRAMLGVLRDGSPDASLAPTTPVAPQDTVAAAQRAGYPVTLSVAGRPAVAPAVDFAIGRIVQEGITNAMRHAPTATAVSVRIDYTAEPVTVDIRNDGVRSAAAEGGGFGLRGLAERAAHVGGTVRAARERDLWMLHAELPSSPRPAQALTPAEPLRPAEQTR